ncbi:glycosyltransferase family 39 protein [Kouleothrix sp.]|uniref:glycosyltransferase family 39 protein n=1 Tax=Kouleothrix sp. TaxID=2779161 RepID=UPI00391DCED3
MNDSKLNAQHARLIGLVVAFIALAALYSAVVPLGEGPDEPGHAGYVFFVARERRLPDQRADEVPGEGHQPPLAYLLAAPLVAWLPAADRAIDWPANPRFTWAPAAGAGPAREPNAVAHGSREFWPWSGATLGWHLARLASVAAGAATVVFTYLAAREFAGGQRRAQDPDNRAAFALSPASFALIAAALVALNPQFLFVSALVTNDALLAALSALLLWLALRRADERRRAAGAGGYALGLGVVLGLALLTKQSALLLAPVAGIAALDRSLRARRGPLASLALLAGATLLVCGWWYWRNLQLYGDLFGLAVFQAEFTTQAFDPRSLAAWGGALSQLHASFWARFGWMNVQPPGWAIWPFVLLEALALAGWGRRLLAHDPQPTVEGRGASWRGWRWPVVGGLWYVLLLPALALAWVVSFALTAGLVAWQGRLLFPALPAIAIVMAYGLASWQSRESTTKKRLWANSTRLLVLGSWLCLALWLPFGVIRPAYPPQALPEATALARLGQPTYARFGMPGDPGAELLGWQLQQPARAGEAAELTLVWHARGRQAHDWTVFVHLVGADDQIVAEDNTRPRGGVFPTTQWVAGDWIEDRHTLSIPASLAPGTYRLRIGLFDEASQQRAGVFSRGGRLLGDHHLVGKIHVE